MQITLELPEDIARGLESRWKDLPRAALESLALEAYRSQALTAAQLRRLLGFETRMQVDAFLKEQAGRQEALRRGLRVAGTISVLDEADQAGLVVFDDVIAEIRRVAGGPIGD